MRNDKDTYKIYNLSNDNKTFITLKTYQIQALTCSVQLLNTRTHTHQHTCTEIYPKPSPYVLMKDKTEFMASNWIFFSMAENTNTWTFVFHAHLCKRQFDSTHTHTTATTVLPFDKYTEIKIHYHTKFLGQRRNRNRKICYWSSYFVLLGFFLFRTQQ